SGVALVWQTGPARRYITGQTTSTRNYAGAVLTRWHERGASELKRQRTEQSFCVPKADIAAQGYDLGLNRYKEIVHKQVETRPPLEILVDLECLDVEISKGTIELRGMLS
ncbi:hypothetical protein AB0D61_10070, partial [Streptomyces sp. NPDC048341]